MRVIFQLSGFLFTRASEFPGDLRRYLPNRSIMLNIIGIVAGISFLTFAVSIYDGYKNKVEAIIFSLTPHVMVRSSGTTVEEEEDTSSEQARCQKVCRSPSSVFVKERSSSETVETLTPAQMSVALDWLKGNAPAGTSASRVVFEEVSIDLQSGRYASGGVRPMRLLGLEILVGERPAPRVDLVYPDFKNLRGVLISDALAAEIEKAEGKPITSGVSVLKVKSAKGEHTVTIAGVHKLGIHAIAENLLIGPYEQMQALAERPDEMGPTYLGVNLGEPADAHTLAQRLRSAIGRRQLTAASWDAVSDLTKQLKLYRTIIIVTLALSLLVTAINTFVNITILIMQRTKHLGILRAMGLKPREVLIVFLMLAIMQSVVGTAIGYALGLAVGNALDGYINSLVQKFVPISNAPIIPDADLFVVLLLVVIAVSTTACLMAGRRVIKTPIIENLRAV